MGEREGHGRKRVRERSRENERGRERQMTNRKRERREGGLERNKAREDIQIFYFIICASWFINLRK